MNASAAGDAGLTPWVSQISPGGGNGNALQFSCLENPMDRGAWSYNPWISKSWTRLWLNTHIRIVHKLLMFSVYTSMYHYLPVYMCTCINNFTKKIFAVLFKNFIYLTARGLSYGTWDLQSWLWHENSLAAAVGSSSLARDRTLAPCSVSVAS